MQQEVPQSFADLLVCLTCINPNTLIEANTEVCIREQNKQDRSTYQLWVESCREV